MIIYILGRFYLPIFLLFYLKNFTILHKKFYIIMYNIFLQFNDIILNVKSQKFNNKKIWLNAKNILYLYELNY